MDENELIFIGETNFRGDRMRFGIKKDDRRRHMYVVGSTGMGKSEFLKSMAIQDIEAGHGVAFIDPHGDPSSELLDYVPEERIKDVIYLNPDDLEYPIAFNVMEGIGFDYRHLVASGLVGVFKKIWGEEAWSGRMEYILNNTILALLEYPDSTLLGINRLMSSKDYRKKVVANITDPIVKAFWTDEFAKYADKFATEATAAIQNKVGQFSSNNLIRNILGQSKSKIDIRKIMDEGKILIVNISRGKIGEDASRLLGAFLVTKIQLAAMSRVDIPETERRDFYLYVDEFQHFATESFANILSEARKFHLSLVMAHQYIKQMEEPVMDAVFGNVGTLVSFRVGAEDAEFLEKWFAPDFMMADIVNLGKRQMYLKLMIDGISSRGFSASTLERFPIPERSYRQEIIEHSRKTYATKREIVEKSISEWASSMQTERSAAEIDGSIESQGRWDRQSQIGRVSTEGQRRHWDARPQYQDRYQERRDSYPPRREESRDFQQGPRRDERRDSRPPQVSQQRSQPSMTRSQGVSLNQAFSNAPVDFHGRKKADKPDLPKKEVNTDELRKILEESLKK
ncbi:MAG: hypothetical protein A2918_02910 [Candidatus Yanofskybacteria bacterium RIFCSPLOWO2_01_FULL_42_49]|uniref:Type IV secretion system coupling protein TraD DNA-binding domain-containing protein n=1 Tax=Candidatus Yanofskybacteria bacterium RIFCSPLOWO2_01_FULL_42_49 TaxID=1802694 RepID=A0A1F8GBI4_9BACT|nr:MAG: hypothetical protein A2918_02910 [Candidatus Yanofskybacteria bacterium RIFCSPLOWO2_01_FULL_42_49]